MTDAKKQPGYATAIVYEKESLMLFSPFATKIVRCLGIVTLALAVSSLAHAQVTGTVYENDTLYSGNADDGPSFDPVYYAGLPSATFTSSGINFQSQVTGYSVGQFYNNPVFSNLMNGFDPTDTADNSFLVLTGNITLQAGSNSFVVAHDDGVVITIGGGIGNVVDQPGPTAEDFTPFNVTAPSAGSYSFVLQYTECCGPPADLVWSINQQIVAAPDSSSTLLLACLGIGSLALVSLKRKLSAA
jgi:hypothetical protein